jgi:hypothetical protein
MSSAEKYSDIKSINKQREIDFKVLNKAKELMGRI